MLKSQRFIGVLLAALSASLVISSGLGQSGLGQSGSSQGVVERDGARLFYKSEGASHAAVIEAPDAVNRALLTWARNLR